MGSLHYKDDELISQKYWDEDGNKIEFEYTPTTDIIY